MWKAFATLTSGLIVTACAPSSRSDAELLKSCWGAVQRPDRSWELPFEALVMSATEGGRVARSRTCTDDRLWFVKFDQNADQQIEPTADRAWHSSDQGNIGIGIRGRAIVVPAARKHEHNLGVRVVRFIEFEELSPEETKEFIRFFKIG